MKKIFAVNLLILLLFQLSFSQTWVRKLDGYSIWSLAKDISGNLYAGVSGTPRCIFKSTNGGSSWDTVLANGVTNFLSISCDSSNCVYAGNGSNGLVKSTNFGLNWTTIPSSTFGGKNVQTVACGKNSHVFVGCITGGIYRSTDNGQTFPVNVISTLTIVTITIDRFNSNIIYAGASSGAAPNYGFYRSTDAGLTFSDNLNPLNIWGIVQKTNGNLYTVTTSSGYPFDKSTNGGLNWATVSNLTGSMRGLCLDASQNFYASGNGGVWKSTNDGVSFSNFGLTYSANQIISYQNKIFAAVSGSSNGGVWIYTDSLVEVKQDGNAMPENYVLFQNYPNPFNPTTKIKVSLYPSKGGNKDVKLIIYDIVGREKASFTPPPLRGEREELLWEVEWDAKDLPSGIYFYTITSEYFTDTKKMVLIK